MRKAGFVGPFLRRHSSVLAFPSSFFRQALRGQAGRVSQRHENRECCILRSGSSFSQSALLLPTAYCLLPTTSMADFLQGFLGTYQSGVEARNDVTVAIRNWFANRNPLVTRLPYVPVERVDFQMYTHKYRVTVDDA